MIAVLAVTLVLQSLAPTQAGKLPDYSCNAEDGHFDKLSISGNESSVNLSGTLTANKVGKIRQDWVPAAGILFQPANGKGGVGLQFWLRNPKIVSFGVHSLGSSDPQEIGKIPLDAAITFQISLNKLGVMEIVVDDRSYELKGVSVDTLHPILMCSGGKFSFTNMTLKSGD